MTSTHSTTSRIVRGLKTVFGGGNPIVNAQRISRSLSLIEQYKKNGRIPWSPGYSKFKNQTLIDTFQNAALMRAFAEGDPLPPGYGARLDERVVECPWAVAKLRSGTGRILDAGSVLNTPIILDLPEIKHRSLFIYSLAIDYERLDPNISYVHSDFRDEIFRDESFESIVCISTLEHVGMWPIPSEPFEVSLAKHQPEKRLDDYKQVLRYFKRLLVPGGRLLLTVPFGKYEDHDWLRNLDAEQVESIKKVFEGECASETYYRYRANGWQTATWEECADASYYNMVRASIFDDDYAAAARAVVCLEMVRR
jgi:hypothetical protein